MDRVLFFGAILCGVLLLVASPGVASAARQCPAPKLDDTTDHPQKVLYDYLSQSNQLALELGLPPSFGRMNLSELLAFVEEAEREFYSK